MIERYEFGRIRIGGKVYTSDLLVFPHGRVQADWWRAAGHRLSMEDLAVLVDAGPGIIVAGTGASGLMQPEPGLAQKLEQMGVELRAMPSAEAVREYNLLSERQEDVAACFHLTC